MQETPSIPNRNAHCKWAFYWYCQWTVRRIHRIYSISTVHMHSFPVEINWLQAASRCALVQHGTNKSK